MNDSRDIKELELELERLKKLVLYDELTGVFNRRGFKEEADRIFAAVSVGEGEFAGRRHLPTSFSIIFLDIDNFKQINDSYGHEIGDQCLQKTGVALQHLLRAGDILGRWGGEEFVIVLLGAGREDTAQLAERLRQNLENIDLAVEGVKVPIAASFGTATYEGKGNLDELINRADKAMYEAKQSGKNRVIVTNWKN